MTISLKQLLQTNDVVPLFTVGRVPHPIFVEMFALAGGYRGFWIDYEHIALTTDHLIQYALAARANQFGCFVRIPPVGYWLVTQCLEAGVGGVMAAQIYSAEQAREFVRWAKFAPVGTRGMNTGGRDADYTFKPPARFQQEANDQSFVAIQIETRQALAEVDEIAAIDGVDLLFVGPVDLSLSLGIPGQFQDDRLWQAIRQVAEACQRYGKHWGAVIPDPQFAAKARELNCRMPTYGNDILVVRRGVEAFKAAFSL